MESASNSVAQSPEAAKRPSTATRLVDLTSGAGIELFHTPAGEAYAVIPAEDHQETWPVRSKAFRLHLNRLHFQVTRTAPNTQAIEEEPADLEAQAMCDGYEDSVHLRVAGWEGRLYLDLGDWAWRVVEIGPDGWQVLERSPVRFRRTRHLQPLPVPRAGASLDSLRE